MRRLASCSCWATAYIIEPRENGRKTTHACINCMHMRIRGRERVRIRGREREGERERERVYLGYIDVQSTPVCSGSIYGMHACIHAHMHVSTYAGMHVSMCDYVPAALVELKSNTLAGKTGPHPCPWLSASALHFLRDASCLVRTAPGFEALESVVQ